VNWGRGIVWILGIYSILILTVVSFVAFGNPATPAKDRAIITMALWTVFLWCVVCGSLMLLFKDKIAGFMRSKKKRWKLRFVVFCVILALIEEAITVTMTNLAPQFGSKIGEAYITASSNYFTTVLFHSVIMFVPMFIVWAFLLKKYDFSALQVFLLFGITGNLAEIALNPSMVFAGFWIFIYGLMIYLPALSIPDASVRGAVKKPKFFTYVFAVILPIIAAIPVALFVNVIRRALGIVFFID